MLVAELLYLLQLESTDVVAFSAGPSEVPHIQQRITIAHRRCNLVDAARTIGSAIAECEVCIEFGVVLAQALLGTRVSASNHGVEKGTAVGIADLRGRNRQVTEEYVVADDRLRHHERPT